MRLISTNYSRLLYDYLNFAIYHGRVVGFQGEKIAYYGYYKNSKEVGKWYEFKKYSYHL